MGKKCNRTISLDADVENWCMNTKENVSGLLNAYLRSYINAESHNINALNLEIKEKELKTKEETLGELQIRIQALRDEIKLYKEDAEKAEMKRLTAEKERQEKLRHCGSCGKEILEVIESKGIKYLLCLNCLASLPTDRAKQYSTE